MKMILLVDDFIPSTTTTTATTAAATAAKSRWLFFSVRCRRTGRVIVFVCMRVRV